MGRFTRAEPHHTLLRNTGLALTYGLVIAAVAMIATEEFLIQLSPAFSESSR